MITRDSISAAYQRITPYIRRTPVMSIATERGPIQIKLESLQVSGTFKARGAFNRLLDLQGAKPDRVVAASGGNHGIAVAYASRELNIEADIFVPAITSDAKKQALTFLGANVHIGGAVYAEAAAASQEFASRHGALISHAYDQVQTLNGQGTVALEWMEQTAGLDTVLVAVGGGGLIGGMAAWLQNSVKIVAVESEQCATLSSARQAGKRVNVEVGGIAADSLGASKVGELMFPISQKYVNDSVLVRDSAIEQAQLFAWQQLRIATEPGGAAALAAWLSGSYRAQKGERVGVLFCGANTAAPAAIAAMPRS